MKEGNAFCQGEGDGNKAGKEREKEEGEGKRGGEISRLGPNHFVF